MTAISTGYDMDAREEMLAKREAVLKYAGELWPDANHTTLTIRLFEKTRYPHGSLEELKRQLQAFQESQP